MMFYFLENKGERNNFVSRQHIRLEEAKQTCYLRINSQEYSLRSMALDISLNYLVLLKCILYRYIILKIKNLKSGQLI